MKVVQLLHAEEAALDVKGRFPAASLAVDAMLLALAQRAFEVKHPDYGLGQSGGPPAGPGGEGVLPPQGSAGRPP
jgi:hypothetical protein